MTKRRRKISNDRVLDEVILELSDVTPAPKTRVKDTDNVEQEIPDLLKREFTFSCPYRIGSEDIYPARPYRGDRARRTGLHRKVRTLEPKGVGVMSYAEDYICHKMGLGKNAEVVLYHWTINAALYSSPQPALDGRDPLNAFRIKGTIYTSCNQDISHLIFW